MGTPKSVDDYLSALPETQQEALRSLRGTIKAAAPNAQETISSGVPAFRYRDKYLVSFGAAKAHVSLFVMRGRALQRLKEELKGYDTSNTVIRFTPDKPLPKPIVERIVKIRMEEIDTPSRKRGMQVVSSADGTKIAFERSGRGPALIIVGGSLADHHFYVPLAGELSRHFTVYNYDRRGRGQSGDTRSSTVERELDDLAALVEHAKGPVFVYGHSAGSALALRAAATRAGIARLVLADPPFTPHSENDEAAKAEFAEEAARLRELHDKGDHRASAKLFLSGLGVPDEDIEGMLDSPAGERLIDSAQALPYDYAALGDGLLPTQLAAKVTAPTLILAPKAMPETAQALADAMPNARFEAMEGPAYETPPAEIARRVTGFHQSQT